jgi:hypothetical protein
MGETGESHRRSELAAQQVDDIGALRARLPATVRDRFGFTVIGHISGNLGQGVTARSYITAMIEQGYPVETVDVDPLLGRHGHDTRFNHLRLPPGQVPRFLFNLIIMAGPSVAQIMPQLNMLRQQRKCLNLLCCWWELSRIPSAWRSHLADMDMLLAGSLHVRETLTAAAPDTPVEYFPHPLYLPTPVRPLRASIGVRDDAIVCLMMFEPASDIERKNPYGALRAFLAAAPPGSGLELVIKLNNAHTTERANKALNDLRSRAAPYPHVHILDANLGYSEVLGLIAECDIFLSLHRAEGLGLPMLEAMRMGKPVVATAWSGNMTFMNDENSCLVPARLTPVPDAASRGLEYKDAVAQGMEWAEPDESVAADWIRRLAADAGLRASIGQRAATSAQAMHDEARKLDVLRLAVPLWLKREGLA